MSIKEEAPGFFMPSQMVLVINYGVDDLVLVMAPVMFTFYISITSRHYPTKPLKMAVKELKSNILSIVLNRKTPGKKDKAAILRFFSFHTFIATDWTVWVETRKPMNTQLTENCTRRPNYVAFKWSHGPLARTRSVYRETNHRNKAVSWTRLRHSNEFETIAGVQLNHIDCSCKITSRHWYSSPQKPRYEALDKSQINLT